VLGCSTRRSVSAWSSAALAFTFVGWQRLAPVPVARLACGLALISRDGGGRKCGCADVMAAASPCDVVGRTILSE
jgi:hypothetical protein